MNAFGGYYQNTSVWPDIKIRVRRRDEAKM